MDRRVFRAHAVIYTPSNQDNTKIAAALLGHWISVAIAGASEGVSKLEFNFLPENRILGVTIQSRKTYRVSGTYIVQNGKLVITENKDARPDVCRTCPW